MATETSTTREMCLTSVGVVRSSLTNPELKARKDGIELKKGDEDVRARVKKISELVSEIVIDDRFDGILEGIEEFSHILVLYWPHLVPDEGRSVLQVHPMGRKDVPLKGVFSTCSPARPNPVLVTAVPLVSREGNVLKVQGLEAVDGSPIIDIKPYMTHYYRPEGVEMAGWMCRLLEEVDG
ncbi:tRNA (N6-threonylcarbamoyladenosine(37)-N6)-methyltransferase TrmO [Desulfoluna butyratoxydans]|uniref:Trna tsaa: trna-thr(Ggu) m(6)t(6)a37 methyltransferase tsaa n=1 Tax=Desulfoluna butyratoxydans TaxID=231438 RepID=A0A4U8YUB0_9BACT|nr:tRNA (N6-threonylcarbamoyladenosine(37)-N6)-methyltransferase TrmO [Desulfoluna butyratoxydans]VFQ45472.1 trna tsaa: trna-thr(ggu) m(6)t(6)a37 methyltransferase tsaa [Desulfoluna butyratoxydans]